MMRRAFAGLCALLLCVLSGRAEAPAVTVVNKGFSGNTTRHALQRLDKEVLALKPQHAVVYFGMNDAMNSACLVPLGEYEANLRTLAKRLKEGGVGSVSLVTLNPVIEPYVRARHPSHPQKASLQSHLAAYDRAVRSVAAELGLPLIDLRALVEAHGGAAVEEDSLLRCEKNGGGKDGVHLTPAAYALLGRSAYEALKVRVKPGETVVCFGDSLTYGASVKGAGTASGETYPAALQRCFDEARGAAARGAR